MSTETKDFSYVMKALEDAGGLEYVGTKWLEDISKQSDTVDAPVKALQAPLAAPAQAAPAETDTQTSPALSFEEQAAQESQVSRPVGDVADMLEQSDIEMLQAIKEDLIDDLTQEMLGATGDSAASLATILQKLQGATSLSELRKAIREAKDILANESGADVGGDESPEQLWNDIKKSIEKADAAIDALDNYVSDEQKKHVEELKAKIEAAEKAGDEEAKAEAAHELAQYYQQIGKDAEAKAILDGNAEAARKAKELQEIGKEVDTETNKYEVAHTASKAKDIKKEVTAERKDYLDHIEALNKRMRNSESQINNKDSEENTRSLVNVARILANAGEEIDALMAKQRGTGKITLPEKDSKDVDTRKSSDEADKKTIKAAAKDIHDTKISKTDLKPETADTQDLGNLPLLAAGKPPAKLQQIS